MKGMRKSKVEDVWAIVHEVVATDHLTFVTTHVKAKTAEEALLFFNEKIADDHWIRKAEIKNVKQFEVYEVTH